jgi:hypothetical protein
MLGCKVLLSLNPTYNQGFNYGKLHLWLDHCFQYVYARSGPDGDGSEWWRHIQGLIIDFFVSFHKV